MASTTLMAKMTILSFTMTVPNLRIVIPSLKLTVSNSNYIQLTTFFEVFVTIDSWLILATG